MSTVRLKFVLWSATAALSLGAVVALAAAVALPLEVPAVEPAPPPSVNDAATRAPAVPSLASFEAAWKTDLRRPLVDPAPSAFVAKAGPTVQLPVRLVGTVASGNRRRGLFMTPDGKVELRAPGEKVGGANVVSVGEKSATLSYNGQTSTLNVEPAPPAPPPAVRKPGVFPTAPSARGADGDS